MNRPTRVLFVDDEPLVLRSIDRVLRARKVPWEARFVERVDLALDLLAAEPFDVVVADLRIPEADGVELLTQVQRIYPHIARLVLSGQVGTDDCLRVMQVAHQCIAKPCDVGVLRHVVQRLSWGKSLLDEDTAVSASELTALPSPPRTYLEVTAAIQRNAGLAELSAILRTDVAATAKLLQIVNSAFFTHGARVASVERALAVLGTDVVRGLLLSVEVFRSFEGNAVDVAKLEALQAHSTFVAQLARAVAPIELAGEAFVAGMLHDLGELALLAMRREGDHARAGAFLLGLWGIADPIVDAVAFHHEPGGVPAGEAGLTDALHLAEIVAGELTAAASGGQEPAELVSPTWMERHDLETLERGRRIGVQLWARASGM